MICVIWLGGHCLDYKDLGEFNLAQDYAAGQLLLNLNIIYTVFAVIICAIACVFTFRERRQRSDAKPRRQQPVESRGRRTADDMANVFKTVNTAARESRYKQPAQKILASKVIQFPKVSSLD